MIATLPLAGPMLDTARDHRVAIASGEVADRLPIEGLGESPFEQRDALFE